MARSWETVDRCDTDEGALELRRRGERDFLITVAGRTLMNSATSRSERVLGERAAQAIGPRPAAAGGLLPRVLVGGLGMGCTLRSLLDGLPDAAEVVVAELNPKVVEWCRGPLASLTESAVDDPRVRIVIGDVAAPIAAAAGAADAAARFDAVVLDLYEGPHAASQSGDDPFYGPRALRALLGALRLDGVALVWGEAPDPAFERRLSAAGFAWHRERPGRGGLRHVIYLARAATTAPPGPRRSRPTGDG